jgi:ATP phosphoribosyltransferase
MNDKFTLALPSKGAISEPTDGFLKDLGLKVSKPNPRQYVGSIKAIALNVLFQRVKDIVYKVSDGTAHLGITGLDVVRENYTDSLVIINDKLGYGHCKLVIAVPEAWVDVNSIADLVEVAQDFRETKGRNIRIATGYPSLARQFLYKHGIIHFTLVKGEGAIEVAPTINHADLIIDLTDTGTTLRENHLKQIPGGTILEAQACLIGNRQALLEHDELRQKVRLFSEYIDAALNGREYYQVISDIQGESAFHVAGKLSSNPLTHGLLGPTIAPIYTPKGVSEGASWHTVTITVSQKSLLLAVDYLRSIGAQHILVSQLKYLFLEQSNTYQQMLEQLGLS